MPSLSMGALQYSGKAGDQPVRVWEERPAGWEYAGLSFALRMTKWGVIFVEGEQPAEIYFTSAFSKYCATRTFHPKSFFIMSRS